MHVAIDIGCTDTYVVCWDTGRDLDDTWIKLKIPGIYSYNTSPAWDHENVRRYLSYIQSEYLGPSRKRVDSAALALPGIFSLNSRRLLLDVCEEILGLSQVMLLPHAIALVRGYQLRHGFPLSGDILVVDGNDSRCGLAILSIIAGVGLTLEKQYTGKPAEVREQAEKMIQILPAGWAPDHCLLAVNESLAPTMINWLNRFPTQLNIISDPAMAWSAAEGLSALSLEEAGQISMIYPYYFYLSELGTDWQPTWTKIPFDTANLELDQGSKYRLTSLDNTYLHQPQERMQFRVYETYADQEPCDPSAISEADLVLEIDSLRADLPSHLELILDMSKAALYLDLQDHQITSPPLNREGLEVYQQITNARLFEQLRNLRLNVPLLKDWASFQAASQQESPHLASIDNTLFHLYGLLQLWYSK